MSIISTNHDTSMPAGCNRRPMLWTRPLTGRNPSQYCRMDSLYAARGVMKVHQVCLFTSVKKLCLQKLSFYRSAWCLHWKLEFSNSSHMYAAMNPTQWPESDLKARLTQTENGWKKIIKLLQHKWKPISIQIRYVEDGVNTMQLRRSYQGQKNEQTQ